MLRFKITFAVLWTLFLTSSLTRAQDWDSISYTQHSEYQSVNDGGSSAYSGGFPIRLVGVVLNNTEDWLDPTAAYDSVYHAWNMGGEAEFYVQALTESTFSTLGVEYYDSADHGGTACWMGQNYGNTWLADSSYNYTNAEWTAELGRLNLQGGDGVTDPIRAGDLVEIRVRGGLYYGGKMNVNEQHSKDSSNDFEVILLESGFGLPTAASLTLSDLKTSGDNCIFDSTRATGGELYQSTLVELGDVWITSVATWAADTDIEVTDGTRTMNIHLGLNAGFDGTELFTQGELFNVTGVLDQSSDTGKDGYQLLVMDPDGFSVVPEPGSLALLTLGSLGLLKRRKSSRKA